MLILSVNTTCTLPFWKSVVMVYSLFKIKIVDVTYPNMYLLKFYVYSILLCVLFSVLESEYFTFHGN